MPRLEKIEYKPVSVRELFVEMKNLSELMIDLAYSAALFNDKELAEDVLELENRVDTLTYLLEMEIMIAARDAEDAEALTGGSKVASAADKISDAAADIAKQAHETGKTIRQIALQQDAVSEDELDKLLDIRAQTGK